MHARFPLPSSSRSLLTAFALLLSASILAAQQPAAPAAPAAPAPAAAPGATPAPGGGAGGPGGGGRGAGGRGGPPPIELTWNDAIPAGNAEHAARQLRESTRKADWAEIAMADGTKLRSWVVHPTGTAKAGVVIVIHDIRGMSDIARAVGDQLAQDGFIAIVPDFLSGKGPNGGGTESLGAGVGQAIQGITDMKARLDAAMAYGKALPNSNGKTAVTGFCWGGTQTFAYAAAQPDLNAAAVFYGDAPGLMDQSTEAKLANVKAPVIGLYGGTDNRINAGLPATEAAMKKHGKSYEIHMYEGAGHGFMGNQGGSGGANLKAAQESWPVVLAFFKKNLS